MLFRAFYVGSFLSIQIDFAAEFSAENVNEQDIILFSASFSMRYP